MSDCDFCNVEEECHYPYKPCDCVLQRKFWDAERRAEYDEAERKRNSEGMVHVGGGQMGYGR